MAPAPAPLPSAASDTQQPSLLDTILQIPAAQVFAPSMPVASAPAQQTGVETVTIQTSNNPRDWNYILQHGNAQWDAVLLDGQQTFRNKRTGKFSSTMSGLGDDLKVNTTDLLMAGILALGVYYVLKR